MKHQEASIGPAVWLGRLPRRCDHRERHRSVGRANTQLTETAGAGSGFMERLLTAPDGDTAEDQIVTVAGSYSASAPLTDGNGWVMQMVAFRAAGSATPTPSQNPVGSVTLAWDRDVATSDPATDTVGYQLHWGLTSGIYTQTTTAGNTTTFTVSNLISGVTYYYVVRLIAAPASMVRLQMKVSYTAP